MTNTEAKLRTLLTVLLFGVSLTLSAFSPAAKSIGTAISVEDGVTPPAISQCLRDMGYRGFDDGREALYPLQAHLSACGG